MDGLIGKTLGTYQVLEQLGQGGMADVYKAYQPSLDRYVAIKVLRTYQARDQEFQARFKREARAVAQLEHPNILAVYDSGHEGDLSYIVMRYVEAGTLKSLMRTPLAMERIVKLIGHIADALDYAHQNGVIHRDVKPSNVLLDRGDWPLLTDFGVARMIGATQELTATGVGMGTPAYMSPEQGLGKRVDRRTDIYSLGVLLFEMLTGALPFEAETPLAVVLKHIHDPLPIPSQVNPGIPEAVERVVLKAMAKAPDDRFQTAAEFGVALDQAVQEAEQIVALDRYTGGVPAAVAAGEKPATRSAGKRLRRLWWLAPVGVGLLLGGLLLVRGNPNLQAEPEAASSRVPTGGDLGTAPGAASSPVPPSASIAVEPGAPSETSLEVGSPLGLEGVKLHDDFSDPAFDGSVNPDHWVAQPDPTCSVRQQGGELIFSNEVSQLWAECRLYPVLNEFPLLPQIRQLESRIWISSEDSEEVSEHRWNVEAELSQGQWVAICAVSGTSNGAGANMTVRSRGGATLEYFKNVGVSRDAWHTLRLEVHPEIAEIACYVDGLLIGSMVPEFASELLEAETRIWMSEVRAPGAVATTHVDDVHIEIVPVAVESLAIYDDFSDPAFEGSLDSAKWVDQSDPTCTARQEQGKLAVTNQTSQEEASCRLHLPFRELPALSQINLLEFAAWISSDHSDIFSEHMWSISADDTSQGTWYGLCGVAARGEGANAFMEVKSLSSEPYRRNIRISFDAWHTLSLVVDPETLEISCFADGLPVGSVIPDAAEELMGAPIRVQLVASRPPGSQATAYIDNVRVNIVSDSDN